MIRHEDILSVFLKYAKEYDTGDTNIERKVMHTMRVAMISQCIAENIGMSEEDVFFAWFIGILHDIGRFEQERQFGTFVDSDSVDHAEMGADILFKGGLIGEFSKEHLPEDWYAITETAIRLHNKLDLPVEMDERMRQFCRLIRDADKADIFRVIATTTFEERAGTSRKRYVDAPEASPEVMECVRRHCCVPRRCIRSVFDNYMAHCCMAFELEYAVTRKVIQEQGFLKSLLLCEGALGAPNWNQRQREQLGTVQAELEQMWGMRL